MINLPYTEEEEALCRVVCKAEGIDPDAKIGGLDYVMPERFQNKNFVWKSKLPMVRAILVYQQEQIQSELNQIAKSFHGQSIFE